MPEILTLREAARRLGVPPRVLHDGFYSGRIGDDCCRYAGSRRVVLETQLPRIAEAIKQRRGS